MKLKLTREEMRDRVKVKKAAFFSIAINVLEIVAGMAMIVLVRKMLSTGVEETIARMTSLLCFTIVGWGAVTDIGASITSLRMVQRTQELEEAYGQLEDLNREMRAQRHDFMNHIQVVYSLIEMNEPDEAMRYMDRIYGDMQRVSSMLRTDCPAVNALIQAKEFANAAHITGVVLTKLDGTAKGGVIIALSREQNIGVKFIGVGRFAGI